MTVVQTGLVAERVRVREIDDEGRRLVRHLFAVCINGPPAVVGERAVDLDFASFGLLGDTAADGGWQQGTHHLPLTAVPATGSPTGH